MAEPRQPVRAPVWQARLLRALPLAIAVLWIAGIASFRDLGLRPTDYGVLLAAAFALQIVLGRADGKRPPLRLPERSNPAVIAVLAATITGMLAMLVGGIAEALAPQPTAPNAPSWPLRAMWHGACAFGASYCRFLARLLPRVPARPGSGPRAS